MDIPDGDLKQRLSSERILLCPGVYDALSALLAEQAGFEALYLSGASSAYTRLGRSDVGPTTYSEVVETLSCITERVGLPLIVDADTGFGNVCMPTTRACGTIGRRRHGGTGCWISTD